LGQSRLIHRTTARLPPGPQGTFNRGSQEAGIVWSTAGDVPGEAECRGRTLAYPRMAGFAVRWVRLQGERDLGVYTRPNRFSTWGYPRRLLSVFRYPGPYIPGRWMRQSNRTARNSVHARCLILSRLSVRMPPQAPCSCSPLTGAALAVHLQSDFHPGTTICPSTLAGVEVLATFDACRPAVSRCRFVSTTIRSINGRKCDCQLVSNIFY
jgi:hypothetical protein